jgi:hypothetical protein
MDGELGVVVGDLLGRRTARSLKPARAAISLILNRSASGSLCDTPKELFQRSVLSAPIISKEQAEVNQG